MDYINIYAGVTLSSGKTITPEEMLELQRLFDIQKGFEIVDWQGINDEAWDKITEKILVDIVDNLQEMLEGDDEVDAVNTVLKRNGIEFERS